MSGRWMIYGANGYTGRLIVEEAKRRGLEPIVAGRRREAIEPIARAHHLETRIFDVSETKANLGGVAAIVLCAGPFTQTSAPVVEACLATGVHYLDITGEISVFEACWARAAEAGQRGVVLLPGVGFDVVPSDCLAASLAAKLPGATSLELAISGGGAPSAGTAKTMLEALPAGGLIRENGELKKVPTAWKTAEVEFADKKRHCVSIPWGDVSTAFRSTKIPNIVVYMALSARAARTLQLAEPLLGLFALPAVRRAAGMVIDRVGLGPKEEERRSSRSHLWGRVRDGGGREVTGTLETPEGYTLTATTAVECAERVSAGRVAAGAQTPSLAFGAGYISEFPGCELRVNS
jgi:short subunit dehydrogenase-like uncharacterized protein